MPRDRGPRAGRGAGAGVPGGRRTRAYEVFQNGETRALVWVSALPGLSGDAGGGRRDRRRGLTPPLRRAIPTGPLAWGPFLWA